MKALTTNEKRFENIIAKLERRVAFLEQKDERGISKLNDLIDEIKNVYGVNENING